MFHYLKTTILDKIHEITTPQKPEVNHCKLDRLKDGRDAKWVIKNRVVSRFRKASKSFKGCPHLSSFGDLFDLPPTISLSNWIYIQLRGRPVDSLYMLTLDHIVPLSQARNIGELKKLMSWKNTRLLDKEINEEKGSEIDNEIRLLCLSLLGRYPDSDDRSELNMYKIKLASSKLDISKFIKPSHVVDRVGRS